MTRFCFFSSLFTFLVVLTLVSCKKDFSPDAAAHNRKSQPLSKMIITRHQDGVASLSVELSGVGPEDRSSTWCTLYEALRFRELLPPPKADDCSGLDTMAHVFANVKFRLVLIHKQTSDIVPVTEFMTVDSVTGLNISWYPMSPEKDYYYSTVFEYCERANSGGLSGAFKLYDFWGDDGYGLAFYPWQYHVTKDCINAPLQYPYSIVAWCILNQDCSVSEP